MLPKKPIFIPRYMEPNVDTPYGYIYITTNLINNKRYIGQHGQSKIDTKYYGSGKALIKAIKKYGKKNFISEPIDWAESKEELDQKEIYWIDFLGAVNLSDFYNFHEGGTGYGSGENNPNFGVVHTEEFKQHLREVARINPDYGMKGKTHTDEIKQHWSQIRKGTNTGEDNPMYDVHLRGELNPFYGHHHTEEFKQNLSNSRKGKNNPMYGIQSPMKGKHLSEETKQKIRNSSKQTVSVVQLSLTKEFICEYQSISQASRKKGIPTQGISDCCRNVTKSCKGYIWVYKQDYIKKVGNLYEE